MFKRIRKFTGRTAGTAAMLMTIALTTPAIANAGVGACAACIACLASCPLGFIGCPWCWPICIACPVPVFP